MGLLYSYICILEQYLQNGNVITEVGRGRGVFSKGGGPDRMYKCMCD